MSLVDKPSLFFETISEVEPSSLDDPFRLGYRNVPVRTLADGEVEYDQIPLTLEDLLFPEESDHAMHTQPHVEDCIRLYCSLTYLANDDPRRRVVGDCRVDFAVPDIKPLGPDIAVFDNVPEEWSQATLRVGDLGARPVLVVEVTSPETRPQDFLIKTDYYHRAGVPVYVIVDSRYRGDSRYDVRLIGFRATPTGYEPIPLDDQGRLWVEPVRCWLKVEGDRVACIDGRDGRVIESFAQQIQGRQAAEAQARAETAARWAAEAETRAETAARVTAEAQARAAEAQARAAEAKADVETAARVSVEAQMAALQAELRRLRGEG